MATPSFASLLRHQRPFHSNHIPNSRPSHSHEFSLPSAAPPSQASPSFSKTQSIPRSQIEKSDISLATYSHHRSHRLEGSGLLLTRPKYTPPSTQYWGKCCQDGDENSPSLRPECCICGHMRCEWCEGLWAKNGLRSISHSLVQSPALAFQSESNFPNKISPPLLSSLKPAARSHHHSYPQSLRINPDRTRMNKGSGAQAEFRAMISNGDMRVAWFERLTWFF